MRIVLNVFTLILMIFESSLLGLASQSLSPHTSWRHADTSSSNSSRFKKKSSIAKSGGDKSPILILSIDGAAIRGIAQFEILRAIENAVSAQLYSHSSFKYQSTAVSKESITDIFDFFAGTSAGSINVGVILIPEKPEEANLSEFPPAQPKYSLEFLQQKLPETIKTAFSAPIKRKLRTLGGLLGSKFTAKPAEKMLQEYAGSTRMSDLVKPAILTSYDLRSREIMNFSTFEACRLSPRKRDGTGFSKTNEEGSSWNDMNVFLWQAIRASCAAPVFYKPLEITINGKSRALIDAGLFVMSPTLLAWVEAQKMYPDRHFIIISISSGKIVEDRRVRAKGATAGGIPAVLIPTIETALEGQQALTDKMMKELPNITYHRVTFDVANKKFDDQSASNIKALREAAQVTIASREFSQAIHDIVRARQERLRLNDLPPFICSAKERNIQLKSR